MGIFAFQLINLFLLLVLIGIPIGLILIGIKHLRNINTRLTNIEKSLEKILIVQEQQK